MDSNENLDCLSVKGMRAGNLSGLVSLATAVLILT